MLKEKLLSGIKYQLQYNYTRESAKLISTRVCAHASVQQSKQKILSPQCAYA